MTHVVVDDQFPDHPKVIGLSDAALACWLRGLCYASRQMTDGHLPENGLRLYGKRRAVTELVEAGLWEIADDGWQIHDYEHRQRTSSDLDNLARERGKAGTLGNHKRWHLARGIVVDNCKWCIANPSQRRSQNDRKTSPERDTDTERDTETDTPIVLSDDHASEALATRDPRAVAAAEILGIRDFDRAKESKDDIVVDSAYRAKCIARRMIDVPALDLLGEMFPTFSSHALADQFEDDRKYRGNVA